MGCGVTVGLAESDGSLPPGLWLTSPASWLPRTGISSGTLRSVIDYWLPFLLLSGGEGKGVGRRHGLCIRSAGVIKGPGLYSSQFKIIPKIAARIIRLQIKWQRDIIRNVGHLNFVKSAVLLVGFCDVFCCQTSTPSLIPTIHESGFLVCL